MEHITDAFQLFLKDTNGVGEAFMGAIYQMAQKSALDRKTHELAYISALVTAKMFDGLPYHIRQALENGARIEEIRSAMLVPLPMMGIQVAGALPYLCDLMEP